MTKKFNVAECKIFVGGIQGSGKSYFTANNLIPSFHNPVIYGVHPSDYKECGNHAKVLIPRNTTIDELNKNCQLIKKMAIKGECDAFVIDEADMFFNSNFDVNKYEHINDLILNHRHYKKGYPDEDNNIKGLAIVIISRRPQDIPTKIIESCRYIVTFAVEGDNVVQKFKRIHPKYEELLKELKYKDYRFVFKEIGHDPVIFCNVKNITEKN
jgi:hypothetical protein